MISGLFLHLGSPDVVGAVVEEFHQRVRNDQELHAFFEENRMCFSKLHQFYILRAVFEGVTPEVSEMIIERHTRLFSTKRLDMGHYYRLFDHLIDAMYAAKLNLETIDEVLDKAVALRRVFVEGVNEFGVGEDGDQEIHGPPESFTDRVLLEQDALLKDPTSLDSKGSDRPVRRSSKINRMVAFLRSPSFLSLSCRSLKASAT